MVKTCWTVATVSVGNYRLSGRMIAAMKHDQPVANKLLRIPSHARELGPPFYLPHAMCAYRITSVNHHRQPETHRLDKLARVKWRHDLSPRKTRSGQQVGEVRVPA